MATVEKISIALPPEMVAVVRSAVDTGEYASSSEVVRDALRDWTQKRSCAQGAECPCNNENWNTGATI
jgi:antitoxin ParD1/3/4